MNPQVLMFLIGIAVVVVVGIVLWAVARRSKSEQLAGSRTAAEENLIARAQEAKTFNIRPLTTVERDRYLTDWEKIEAHFVDRPTTAVIEADELVELVMRTRGYPMGDFEKDAILLSVKHPRVVEHYRAGHAIIDSHGRGAASTEDLRQAMLHYRALFEDLVRVTTDVARPLAPVREVEEKPEVRPATARDDRPGRGVS